MVARWHFGKLSNFPCGAYGGYLASSNPWLSQAAWERPPARRPAWSGASRRERRSARAGRRGVGGGDTDQAVAEGWWEKGFWGHEGRRKRVARFALLCREFCVKTVKFGVALPDALEDVVPAENEDVMDFEVENSTRRRSSVEFSTSKSITSSFSAGTTSSKFQSHFVPGSPAEPARRQRTSHVAEGARWKGTSDRQIPRHIACRAHSTSYVDQR